MPRRNHSRRVYDPYGGQRLGYAEDFGSRQEPMHEAGRRDEGWDKGQGVMSRWGDVRQMVSERPQISLMTAFGVGFGLGLLVTLMLSRHEETWFERYAPDAIQDLPDRLKRAGHKLGDSMSGSLRDAGESLASYVPRSWKPW